MPSSPRARCLAVVMTLGLACGGRRPAGSPTPAPLCVSSATCPAGTTEDELGQCHADEPVPTQPGRLDVWCAQFAWMPLVRYMVVPGAAPLDAETMKRHLDGAHGTPGVLRDCPAGQTITFSLAPGTYQVIHEADDGKDVGSFEGVVFPDDPAKKAPGGARQGAWILPRAVLEDLSMEFPIGQSFTRLGHVGDAPIVDGVLELRIVSLDGGGWFFDQLVLERGPERVRPVEHHEPSVLSTVDGRGVVVDAGRVFRARFRLPPSWSQDEIRVVAHGRRLGPGDRPRPRGGSCVVADVCPEGSRRDGVHGCVATEPLIPATPRPVRVKLVCGTDRCGLLSHPKSSPKLPVDATAWEQEVLRRKALGEPAWFAHEGAHDELDLLPGRYAAMSAHPAYGFHTRDEFVEPDSPMTIDLRSAQPGLHCPTIAWLDAPRATFTSPVEILQGARGRQWTVTMHDIVAGAPVRDGILELRLGEMQPETAFVDQLVVEVDGEQVFPLEGGASSVLAEVDGHVLRLDEGRKVRLRYRLPNPRTGPVKVWLLVNGYYERLDGN